VDEADLGVNFFLDEASLGQSRARACAELLVELNPEVDGDWFPKNDVRNAPKCPIRTTRAPLMDGEQESLDLAQVLAAPETYTVVVFTQPIKPEDLQILETYSREHKTPLFEVHSAGFYAYFRVHLPGAFPIVDTHPDSTATTDLRLLTPWDELSALADELTLDIDNLPNHEHGHIPYVVILLHHLKIWRQAHDGAYPSTYAEKVAFRKAVADAARTDTPEGGEENFDEAVAAVLKTILPPSLPASTKQVFDYEHADPVSLHLPASGGASACASRLLASSPVSPLSDSAPEGEEGGGQAPFCS
jgi:amyloid beta precursor protein binding protein 1